MCVCVCACLCVCVYVCLCVCVYVCMCAGKGHCSFSVFSRPLASHQSLYHRHLYPPAQGLAASNNAVELQFAMVGLKYALADYEKVVQLCRRLFVDLPENEYMYTLRVFQFYAGAMMNLFHFSWYNLAPFQESLGAVVATTTTNYKMDQNQFSKNRRLVKLHLKASLYPSYSMACSLEQQLPKLNIVVSHSHEKFPSLGNLPRVPSPLLSFPSSVPVPPFSLRFGAAFRSSNPPAPRQAAGRLPHSCLPKHVSPLSGGKQCRQFPPPN